MNPRIFLTEKDICCHIWTPAPPGVGNCPVVDVTPYKMALWKPRIVSVLFFGYLICFWQQNRPVFVFFSPVFCKAFWSLQGSLKFIEHQGHFMVRGFPCWGFCSRICSSPNRNVFVKLPLSGIMFCRFIAMRIEHLWSALPWPVTRWCILKAILFSMRPKGTSPALSAIHWFIIYLYPVRWVSSDRKQRVISSLNLSAAQQWSSWKFNCLKKPWSNET